MDFITILSIAVGLSMDALAVAMACGVLNKTQKYYNALKFGSSFGSFQMLMPIMGWALGISFQRYISAVDHWIAFVLLVGIGAKMIYEAFKISEFEACLADFNLPFLLGMSIATSIDALAVGLSFACLRVSIVGPVVVIGLITFILSYLGFLVGERFGSLFEKKIEILGGSILIAIGVKIIIQHLS